MATFAIGILHPGAMGVSLGAAVRAAGHDAVWQPAGRSEATRARAEEHGLIAAADLGELCERCPVVVSVCPPHAAVEVARSVAGAGFGGLYLDANAISPARTREVAVIVGQGGAAYVDGGIVGPPAWQPGTCLYLSGPRAADIPPLFDGSALETKVIGTGIDTASALKMCYAARTKGTAALNAVVMAAAEALGVREELTERWASEDPEQSARYERGVRGAAPKAWRWIDEMNEIAATLRAAGTEGGFHDAAAAIYERLEGFKDADGPELEAILAALREDTNETSQ